METTTKKKPLLFPLISTKKDHQSSPRAIQRLVLSLLTVWRSSLNLHNKAHKPRSRQVPNTTMRRLCLWGTILSKLTRESAIQRASGQEEASRARTTRASTVALCVAIQKWDIPALTIEALPSTQWEREKIAHQRPYFAARVRATMTMHRPETTVTCPDIR